MRRDQPTKRHVLGIDIGGTFTDLVLFDRITGELVSHKVLTTPANPELAVLDGVRELLARQGGARTLETVIHATTLVVNALVERKGVKTGLLTTEGFKDVLEMRREDRYDVYDLFLEFPPPLVPRFLRREIRERIDAAGHALIPLDASSVMREGDFLAAQGVKAIAIVFLHAYADGRHEEEAAAMLRQRHPHIHLSLSSRVAPEIREFERTSTTVANVYVQPLTENYLGGLSDRLRNMDYDGPLYVMLSSGGIGTVETVQAFPVRMIESGPAAGVMACLYHGSQIGDRDIVCFDMGGTTAKFSVVRDLAPSVVTEFEVARTRRFKKGSGIPIRAPVVDLIEIGAGGGSLAHVDHLGFLQVGPESAGADPGPACYDRGGDLATVTDADLVLGYLNPDYFLGGKMHLVSPRARQAIEARVGRPLGVDVVEAAWRVFEMVNENMAAAARMHLAERGLDPGAFTMFAFGGAGPVHAHRVARALGIRRIVCPYAAGVASAFGLLTAPLSFEKAQSYVSSLEDLNWDRLTRLLRDIDAEVIATVERAGVTPSEVAVESFVDMRYSGQSFEITLPLPRSVVERRDGQGIQNHFEDAYRALYGRLIETAPIEVVSWRVRGVAARSHFAKRVASKGRRRRGALKGHHLVFMPEGGGFIKCPVFDRYGLDRSWRTVGPAIVEERESTVVIGVGWKASVDASHALTLERAAS
jgi:N-methylhydantoinase A